MTPARPLQPVVFRFGRIGDMIMVSAVLRFLHRRYGAPCHVVGAGPWTPVVFEGNPDVEQVWTFRRHAPFPFSLTWPRVVRMLHRTDPGPIYVCEYQYRQLPRIKRMLAFSGINPRRCLFIGDDPKNGKSWVESMLRFGRDTPAALSAADYPLPDDTETWAPRLQILDSERTSRDAWLEAQGWAGRPLILVQPGNHRTHSNRRERWRRLNTDDKAWPIERWAALLHRIHERMPHALIMLRGSAEELSMLEEIRAAAGLAAVVVVQLALRPSFALCEAAHSMISTDTGLAHAAAAVGLPLVVMYGVESPRVWLPRSPSGSPVLSVGGPPVSERADQIPVETLFNAWCALLDYAGRRSGESPGQGLTAGNAMPAPGSPTQATGSPAQGTATPSPASTATPSPASTATPSPASAATPSPVSAATPARAGALSPIVIRFGAVGDMITFTSLVHLLHRRYGKPCVVIGAGPWNKAVFRGNSDVARVLSLHRHLPSLLDPTGWRVLLALRRSWPAPVYVCDDDKHLNRTRRLLSMSGVDRSRCVFLGSRAPEAEQHQIDYLLSCGARTPASLRAENYPVPPAVPAHGRLAHDEAELAAMRAWVNAQGWSDRELVLVHPGNRRTMSTQRARHRKFNRDDKAWPMQRWTELFARVHARLPAAMILLCGSQPEVPLLREMQTAAGAEYVAIASLPLRPFFALCRLAHSMISIDTGPAHAAAVLGVPLVVLFGGQRPSRWLPRGPGTPVIALGGPPSSSHVDQISVDAVFSAWSSLAAQVPSRQVSRPTDAPPGAYGLPIAPPARGAPAGR